MDIRQDDDHDDDDDERKSAYTCRLLDGGCIKSFTISLLFIARFSLTA